SPARPRGLTPPPLPSASLPAVAALAAHGRSAFMRDAVELYFATKHRRDVDRRIATAYGDKSHDLLVDVEAWTKEQVWPEK
ncbi:MAG TPA: hypothetical protein VK607_12335, partial [Kofleriaceae bacterium]|nr:hypothetical protein [Kofleriaceae bacterium]